MRAALLVLLAGCATQIRYGRSRTDIDTGTMVAPSSDTQLVETLDER